VFFVVIRAFLSRQLPKIDPRRLQETLSPNGILFLDTEFSRRFNGMEDWTTMENGVFFSSR